MYGIAGCLFLNKLYYSKCSRLYYSNKANPTDCTTATKQTQQIVLQQHSKPNRLYYSNKANPTDCTTATQQTQQIVLQQHSKLNQLVNICLL